ncbi:MAG: sporulation protein YunB [Firmicutes bacterium]|nr:sporulation protein YunB [Bacillota bacterium]
MFRRRNPLLGTAALALLLLVGAAWGVDRLLGETVMTVAEATAVQTATRVVEQAVKDRVAAGGAGYDDLVRIHKDDEGRVVLVQANTAAINRLTAETALEVERALEELGAQKFTVPLGQILGIKLLAYVGPKISMHIVPVGTVRVNLQDRFEEAGINQTRHAIYVDFDTAIRIVVPLYRKDARIATRVPLTESIIVGSVPQTLVQLPAGLLGGALPR